ncbi:unnamed protein product [Echinostoma caproni]|uniref:ATP-binding protein n=1 Tax=Echinostoma caproni TaxID=27848 RepID=A0A183B5M9_9TREM|nr:unnamed protein product [Echinostoma caproni]
MQQFLSQAHDQSSVDEFVELVNAQQMMSSPKMVLNETAVEVEMSLNAKLLVISVGTIAANIRSWTDVFTQARNSAPCVLLLDDIESMEKSTAPVGTFRLTCLLKSQLLKDLVGSGVVLVGETRSLLASLPQSIVDLFTQRITFGMLREEHRLNLFRRYLTEESSEFVLCNNEQAAADDFLQLSDGLTCMELARRTPGYEVGDIIRFVAHLRMSVLARVAPDSDIEEDSGAERSLGDKSVSFTVGKEDSVVTSESINFLNYNDKCPRPLRVTRDLVDECLTVVVPAVKNTAEFVTIPDVTWANVGGLEGTKTQLHNRFMVRDRVKPVDNLFLISKPVICQQTGVLLSHGSLHLFRC